MNPWKYTNAAHDTVFRLTEDGAAQFRVAEGLGPSQILPEDPQISSVPSAVTPRQFDLACIDAGLYDAIQAAIAAADLKTQITYHKSTMIERNNPVLVAMAANLGKSAADIDALFIAASKL